MIYMPMRSTPTDVPFAIGDVSRFPSLFGVAASGETLLCGYPGFDLGVEVGTGVGTAVGAGLMGTPKSRVPSLSDTPSPPTPGGRAGDGEPSTDPAVGAMGT